MHIVLLSEYSDGVYILEKAFKKAYARHMPKENLSSDDEFRMSRDRVVTHKTTVTRKPGTKQKKQEEVNTVVLNKGTAIYASQNIFTLFVV